VTFVSTPFATSASPECHSQTIPDDSSDSNKLLPASDPWAVAANPVAFISTPPAIGRSEPFMSELQTASLADLGDTLLRVMHITANNFMPKRIG